MAFARTLVEDKAAEAAIDSATKSNAGVESVLDGLKWRLARQPECGVLLPDGRLLVHSMGTPAFPDEVVLLYSYSADEVFVHGIRVIPPHEGGIMLVPAKSA